MRTSCALRFYSVAHNVCNVGIFRSFYFAQVCVNAALRIHGNNIVVSVKLRDGQRKHAIGRCHRSHGIDHREHFVYRNDVPGLECSGVADYREAAAVFAGGDRCTLGDLLYAVGKCILTLCAGVDLLAFQHCGGVGEHGGHFAVGYGLLGHELAVDKCKPVAVYCNLRIVGVGQ